MREDEPRERRQTQNRARDEHRARVPASALRDGDADEGAHRERDGRSGRESDRRPLLARKPEGGEGDDELVEEGAARGRDEPDPEARGAHRPFERLAKRRGLVFVGCLPRRRSLRRSHEPDALQNDHHRHDEHRAAVREAVRDGPTRHDGREHVARGGEEGPAEHHGVRLRRPLADEHRLRRAAPDTAARSGDRESGREDPGVLREREDEERPGERRLPGENEPLAIGDVRVHRDSRLEDRREDQRADERETEITRVRDPELALHRGRTRDGDAAPELVDERDERQRERHRVELGSNSLGERHEGQSSTAVQRPEYRLTMPSSSHSMSVSKSRSGASYV